LTVHLGTIGLLDDSLDRRRQTYRSGVLLQSPKEPNIVTAKTEAMHIPARGFTTPDPTATEGYDVLDNGRFISFCGFFRYLGTQITPDHLEETFEIDTRIRAATRSFTSMKNLFNKDRSEDS
jgi:hypothetical protein